MHRFMLEHRLQVAAYQSGFGRDVQDYASHPTQVSSWKLFFWC